MTTQPAYIDPHDATGTPAHEKLREFWGVVPGGKREHRKPAAKGDTLSNLAIATAERNAARSAHYDRLAREAWELYSADPAMTIEEAAAAVGVSDTTLRRRWIAMRLKTR